MRKFFILILISALVFAYVVPEKMTEEIPFGPIIRQQVRSIADPIIGFIGEFLGEEFADNDILNTIKQEVNTYIESVKQGLKDRINKEVDTSIDDVFPVLDAGQDNN